MQSPVVQKSTFTFLRSLARNNDREWFNSNKHRYLDAKENMEFFLDALIAKMNQHDALETPSGKKALFRIYNDVRFAKDKTPYDTKFVGRLRRATSMRRGGYYFWFKPGGSGVGCGFTNPNPDDLKRIRQDIALNHEDWNALLKLKRIRSTFGPMQGITVKTAPKGYSKDHTAIELLRYKQYWFERSWTDQEVLEANFLTRVNNTFKNIRPFFDYMSEVLTTDLNGELII
jgi:uncharacterized protein (TIGR02453 family)